MTQIERALSGYALPVLLAALSISFITVLSTYRCGASRIRSLACGGLTGSVTCVLGVTLAPSIGTPSGIELLPFTNAGSAGVAQMLGNVLLAAPSGFFCVLATKSLRRSLQVGLFLCVAVEVAQLVLPLGRITSVEDAILTTLGWASGSSVAALVLGLKRRGIRVQTAR